MMARLRMSLRMRLIAMPLLFGLGGPLAAQDAAAPPAGPSRALPEEPGAAGQPAALPPAPGAGEPVSAVFPGPASGGHADAAPPASLPAPEIVVRQSLDPASGAVIGQHVALLVDVLFRAEMPRPPRVSLPEIAGVQVLRFETQATTMREEIGGAPYVGQRFEFALYARRGGTVEIPAASIVLLDRAGEESGTTTGHAVPLVVSVPPGVDPSQPLVATRRMTLSQQWSPDPKGAFKAGDAIVRTIVRSAEDVPGLAMRDLAFPAPEGVRVYMDPPDIADHGNRGVVTGRRTDRVTYVFERGGAFELPEAAQPWWDLGAGALRTERAAGVAIAVAAAPPAGPGIAGGGLRAAAWAAIGAGLLALVAVAAVVLRRRRAAAADRAEPAAFARLRGACAGTDAAAVYRAFAQWRAVLDPARGEAAAEVLGPLDEALFAGGSSGWNESRSSIFLDDIARVRGARPSTRRAESLPALNP